jgi:hypothetical protein
MDIRQRKTKKLMKVCSIDFYLFVVTKEKRKQDMKNSAKSTYQVLNWLADNAINARDICDLLSGDNIHEERKVIRRIIKDITELNAKAKTYFKENKVLHSDEDYIKLLKFVSAINDECYHKHCKKNIFF